MAVRIPGQNFKAKGIDNFVDVGSKVSVPNTQIINRAKIPDLANDLSAGFGLNRIMTQQIYQVQGESDPNGKPVYGTVGDELDQIRFVGKWASENSLDGRRVRTTTVGDYVEVTFYGTGLNLLSYHDPSGGVLAETTDGVAGGTISVVGSGVITYRGYDQNMVRNIKSGLTLGWHTVSMELTSGYIYLNGFEVINENGSSIKVNPGTSYVDGNKLELGSQASLTYNSGFESGTLGTKGGHVLMYQKSDGTIAHAVTPTEANKNGLSYVGSGWGSGLADHSNEEVIRVYNWKEFGCGRSDDFSLSVGTGDYGFTLDDGTTTLVAQNIAGYTDSNGSYIGTGSSAGDAFIALTFVGTGLDIKSLGISATSKVTAVYVDGLNIGNLPAALDKVAITKIVSGLEYGTHVVKFFTAGLVANSMPYQLMDFIVYGPKEPALPAGASKICDYYVMADFSQAASGIYPSNGVLRKQPVREMVYEGTWNDTGISVAYPSGYELFTTTLNSKATFWFYGTGFDFRMNSEANMTMTISLDDSSNFSGVANSFIGTGSAVWTEAAGTISGNGGVSDSLAVSGLSLGLHKVIVELTATSGGGLYIDNFDIITPIHSPKSNQPNLQNTIHVGSNSLGDLRKFSPVEDKVEYPNYAKATGVISSPTTGSGSAVPQPDMLCTIKTSGKPLDIFFMSSFTKDNTTGASFHIYVDGELKLSRFFNYNSTSITGFAILEDIVDVPAGVHMVQIYWNTSGGGTLTGAARQLIVKELK